MITVEEAVDLIRKHRRPPREGLASIENLLPDITAEPLKADHDSPPFDRVTMDGICVSFETYRAGLREFQIAGICAAGAPKAKLDDAKTCLEIMTGAALAENADLVIPYENLKIENGIAKVITETERVRFENVHAKGSDCREGALVLKEGRRLTGPNWGIAASFGYFKVKTQTRPRIKIISTGDELVEVSAKPLPYQIRRSNAYALKATLLQHGYPEVELDHVRDDEEQIKAHYLHNAPKYDVLIYSGGVSKGKFDHLQKLWEGLGVQKIFHGVSQRPGKPLWFGVDQNTMVFGLPGNPVSSLVCIHRYFLEHRKMFARLTSDVVFEKDLTFFNPVRLEFLEDGSVEAEPLKMKNSGEFTALAESDGFIELPRGKSLFRKGESYPFFAWGHL